MSSKPSTSKGGSQSGSQSKSAPMTKEASQRIQSTQATSGKDMSSKGFAARAQSAADKPATKK
jgi:hypothetical protein